MSASSCSCGHPKPVRRARNPQEGSLGYLVTILGRRRALRKRLPLAHVLDVWART